ncbi:unnamed protein product, partial [Ectocarpus sp. 6 AP-2014]
IFLYGGEKKSHPDPEERIDWVLIRCVGSCFWAQELGWNQKSSTR